MNKTMTIREGHIIWKFIGTKPNGYKFFGYMYKPIPNKNKMEDKQNGNFKGNSKDL